MTKVLLDCVVTARDPDKCSTNIQYLTFVRQTLERREDVFFYWLIPDWITEEQFLRTYPQDPRVRYLRVPQHIDRTKEYLTLSPALDRAVAFNGDLWDYDVLLTMRTGLVPLLKMLATSPRGFTNHWMRQVWLLEAMVLMEFKDTVCTFVPEVQDRFTLAGYLAADRTWLTSQRDLAGIVSRARELLPPSAVRELSSRIVPAGYAQFSTIVQKPESTFPRPQDGVPLCIAFVGRMEKANRIEEINDLMVKQFVMRGDRVKLLVCTQSATTRVFDESVVEVKMASRKEFWEHCRTDMHVVIKMSVEGGSALSLLEPMMMGVPAIVGPRAPTEETLGKDYPFIANNETEAYALAKQFYDDYPAMYAKWVAWQTTSFAALIKARMEERSVYRLMEEALEEVDGIGDRVRKAHPTWAGNQFVADILAEVGDADEFVMSEVIGRLVAAHKVEKKILDKLAPGDRDARGLIWCTDFNRTRRTIKDFHGWEDAGTTVGHLRRVR